MGSTYTAFRFASILSIVLLASLSPDRTSWSSLAWSLALSHYFIGLLYSRKQLFTVLQQPTAVVSLGLLMTAGMSLYLIKWPLLYYFGIHHALNEVYMLNRITPSADSRDLSQFRGVGWLLHLVLYGVMLRKQPDLSFLNAQALWGALALAYIAYGMSFLRVRSRLTRQEQIDNSIFEILGVVFVVASLWVDFTALQVACYHFAFWIFYPASSLLQAGKGFGGYLGLTVGALALFVGFSPLALLEPHCSFATYREAFNFFSYFHITLSFALSDANPDWIRRMFSSSRRVLVTA